MRITTANVQSLPLMDQAKVLEDVARAYSDADVVLWQEIRPLRYRRAVRSRMGTWQHSPIWRDGGCPISWRRSKFQLLEAGAERIYDGTPGITPRRMIMWVLLRDRETGALVLVHNTHYVAKPFSHKFVPDRAIRLLMWRAGNKTHRKLLDRWERAGYLIVGGGDFNRMNFNVVGTEVNDQPIRYADFGRGSIDYVFVINSPLHRWSPLQTATFPMHSDHAGRRVTAQIRKWS